MKPGLLCEPSVRCPVCSVCLSHRPSPSSNWYVLDTVVSNFKSVFYLHGKYAFSTSCENCALNVWNNYCFQLRLLYGPLIGNRTLEVERMHRKAAKSSLRPLSLSWQPREREIKREQKVRVCLSFAAVAVTRCIRRCLLITEMYIDGGISFRRHRERYDIACLVRQAITVPALACYFNST